MIGSAFTIRNSSDYVDMFIASKSDTEQQIKMQSPGMPLNLESQDICNVNTYMVMMNTSSDNLSFEATSVVLISFTIFANTCSSIPSS